MAPKTVPKTPKKRAGKKVAKRAQVMRSELYRDAVLEAAELEFAARGFADAHMQRVADRAGLSVGSVYNLFESKDALFAAILKPRNVALMQRVAAAMGEGGTLFTRLTNAIRAHAAFCAEHPSYARIQLQRGLAWTSPSGRSASELKYIKQGVAAATALIAQAVEAGELIDEQPRRLLLTLMAVYQAHLQVWVEGDMHEPVAQMAERVITLLHGMYLRR